MNAEQVSTDDAPCLDGADVCPICLAELNQHSSSCEACHAPVIPSAVVAPFEGMLMKGTAFKREGRMPPKVRFTLIFIFFLIACFGGWMVVDRVSWLWECSHSGKLVTVGQALSAVFAAIVGITLIACGGYGALKHWDLHKTLCRTKISGIPNQPQC
ncbi:MAG: hypothetical protein IPK22_05660 [Verrucomicrobiaceae bacterium]|nr:hypothetical protein [Verrucomicrobiaceae bacterium]